MQQAYPSGGAGGGKNLSDKGFFGGLFDFSFSTFITTKIVKVVYGLWILLAGLMILGMFGTGAFAMVNGAALQGLLFIVVSPIAGFLVLVSGRLYMELLIVIFRIAENLTEINRKTKEPS